MGDNHNHSHSDRRKPPISKTCRSERAGGQVDRPTSNHLVLLNLLRLFRSRRSHYHNFYLLVLFIHLGGVFFSVRVRLNYHSVSYPLIITGSKYPVRHAAEPVTPRRNSLTKPKGCRVAGPTEARQERSRVVMEWSHFCQALSHRQVITYFELEPNQLGSWAGKSSGG